MNNWKNICLESSSAIRHLYVKGDQLQEFDWRNNKYNKHNKYVSIKWMSRSVGECMSKWMNEWENQQVGKWASKWINEWTNERVSKWVRKWVRSNWARKSVSHAVHERVGARANKLMCKSRSKYVSEWASESVGESVSESVTECANERVSGWMEEKGTICKIKQVCD